MFGETVRAHRQRLGITQVELARATGISVRNIRNIEAGRVHRPRPATVRLLADTFQLRDADRDRFCQLALRAGSDDEQVGRVAPAPGWPAYPAPAQLPLDVAAFAGREQQLQRLDELLDDKGASARTTIATIAGTAGVGKTALAVHWSHRVRDRFPDGQLYVNLRGFDPAGSVVHPAEAIRGFLDAFAMPPQQIPAGVPAQAALYRSLLAGKRALVLLDNARDADQVRPLLPGSPGCLVVVTSSPAWSPPRAPTPSPWTYRPSRRRASCWPAVWAPAELRPTPMRWTTSSPGAHGCRWRSRSWPPASRPSPASGSPRSPTSCGTTAGASTRSPAQTRPPTCGQCSPGPTGRSAGKRRGCSGC